MAELLRVRYVTTFGPNGQLALDATTGDEVKQYPSTLEVGSSGLKRTSGYVNDEFLSVLRGRKGVEIFREMGDNCAVVAGYERAVTQLLCQIDYRVESASSKAEDRANAEFVEQCMNDMSNSWADTIAEICSFVRYGWAWHEIVYKRRVGPWEKSGKTRSSYTDKRIGWRKIAGRSQDTMIRWVFDEAGGIRALVQMAPPRYEKIVIPIEKSLLFRTSTARNSPEGKSLFRGSYQAWWTLKRMQEIELIGVERDLAGMPVAKVPPKILEAKAGTQDYAMQQAIRQMVTKVRRNEQDGLLWPWVIDEETKQPQYVFELMNSGGSRQFDIEGMIVRLKTEILQALLADFLQVGHEDNGGSYALHTDKSGLFRTSINALAQKVCDVFNRHAIPKLFALNGIKPAELPKLVPNDVDPPALPELGAFFSSLTSAGLQLFPNPELEKFVYSAARLPEPDEDIEKMHETAQRQQAILELAQQKLQLVQTEQQAEQGELQMQQARMGMAQQQADMLGQAEDMERPPPLEGQQADPGDPDGAQAQAQAGEVTNQARIGTATAATKLSAEKEKLRQLKRRPAAAGKRPAGKPVKKADTMSAFGIDHGRSA